MYSNFQCAKLICISENLKNEKVKKKSSTLSVDTYIDRFKTVCNVLMEVFKIKH